MEKRKKKIKRYVVCSVWDSKLNYSFYNNNNKYNKQLDKYDHVMYIIPVLINGNPIGPIIFSRGL